MGESVTTFDYHLSLVSVGKPLTTKLMLVLDCMRTFHYGAAFHFCMEALTKCAGAASIWLLDAWNQDRYSWAEMKWEQRGKGIKEEGSHPYRTMLNLVLCRATAVWPDFLRITIDTRNNQHVLSSPHPVSMIDEISDTVEFSRRISDVVVRGLFLRMEIW